MREAITSTDDQGSDDILRAPIYHRQKWREMFAGDCPGNGEGERLNENRDDGNTIGLFRFAMRTLACEQKNRAEIM